MNENTTVDVVDAAGKKTGSVELPGALFDVQANVPLMHQVVTAQFAAARQGTHATKTRGNVSGGGKKPWRQKGTGRARQGSIRAPQWAGGGTVHGPQPRSYSQRTPKKMVAAALRGALSDRAREGRLHVVDAFVPGEVPSTKSAAAVLNGLGDYSRVIVVLDRSEVTSWLSLRNLDGVHVVSQDQLNTYDVVVADAIAFSTAGLDSFIAAHAADKPVTAAQEDAK
ncbi:50S ribosomal protein L4 [Propionibacterium sp.]|uniref:50S ribosomal protein L4 n=1 Tax=Propionibacterium sp. TaxID=1977903 RepID=UPI0039E950E8